MKKKRSEFQITSRCELGLRRNRKSEVTRTASAQGCQQIWDSETKYQVMFGVKSFALLGARRQV